MSDSPKRLVFYKDKLGHRAYTLASLQEKIEAQFSDETANRPDILADYDSPEKQWAALAEVADYVLAQDYVTLPAEERAQIIRAAIANLFYFGPLDEFLRDPEITELAIEAHYQTLVRRAWGEMQAVPSPFDGLDHLAQTLGRLLAPARTALLSDYPFVEVGIKLHGRPVRASIIAPPINPMYSVGLRLHPPRPYTLADFVPHILSPSQAEGLQRALAEGRGLMITGEVGVGKTGLLGALLNTGLLGPGGQLVERAEEVVLSAPLARSAAIPPPPHEPVAARSFGQQIQAALDSSPAWLALDEIRGDEAAALWSALSGPGPKPLLLVFRGSGQANRLLSAFSMALRKAQPALAQGDIQAALLAKLPYVLALHRAKGSPHPQALLWGEWFPSERGGVDLRPL